MLELSSMPTGTPQEEALLRHVKGIIRHKKKNRGFLAKICSTI